MVCGFGDWNRGAEKVGHSYIKCQLKFIVQSAGRKKLRQCFRREGSGLPGGASDGISADDYG